MDYDDDDGFSEADLFAQADVARRESNYRGSRSNYQGSSRRGRVSVNDINHALSRTHISSSSRSTQARAPQYLSHQDFNVNVLRWQPEQLQYPLAELKRLSPLPARYRANTYSSYSSRYSSAYDSDGYSSDDEPASYSSGDSISKYYNAFLPLILEEARAMLADGIERADENRLKPFTIEIERGVNLPKNIGNPSTFNVRGVIPKDQEHSTTMNVLLLESGAGRNKIRMLGLATEDVDNNKLRIKVILDDAVYEANQRAFGERAKWQAYFLGALVSHQRMFDICKEKQPREGVIPSIVSGELTHQADRYFRLSDEQEEKLSKLNKSQQTAVKTFLARQGGMTLLQGPPGTGKTTTIVAMLQVLALQNKRVLVAAPSNKAVQVIAERLYRDAPDEPMILAGVEKKIPDHLRPIFLHTFRADLVQLLANQYENCGRIMRYKPRGNKTIEDVKDYLVQCRRDFREDFQVTANRLRTYNLSHVHYSAFRNVKKYYDQLKAAIEALEDKQEKPTQKMPDQNINDLTTNDIQDWLNKQDEKPVPHKPIAEVYDAQKKTIIDSAQRLQNEVFKVQTELQRQSDENFEKYLLNHSRFVFATLSVCGRRSMAELSGFDILVVDEAGQAVEAETLIPFQHNPSKVVLVGDTKQLPATTMSDNAKKFNFDRSMMSRLTEECRQECLMLNTQYRMHPSIVKWPSKQYYEGRLITAPEILERVKLPKDDLVKPYAFYSVESGREYKNFHSFQNEKEADYVLRLVQKFRSHEVTKDLTIGVITFYSAQVNLIQNKLKQLPRDNKTLVSSVDGFQGDERDIIIISFVRSNNHANIGFVSDFRRLNVAITRAKSQLVMLGDASTVGKANSDVKTLVENAQKRGHFYPEAVLQTILPQPKPVVVQRRNNNQAASSSLTAAAASSSSSRAAANGRSSTAKICRFFSGKPGSCNNGDDCGFKHVTPKGGASSSSSRAEQRPNQSNKAKASDWRAKRACNFFNGKTGSCRHGDECHFRHDANIPSKK